MSGQGGLNGDGLNISAGARLTTAAGLMSLTGTAGAGVGDAVFLSGTPTGGVVNAAAGLVAVSFAASAAAVGIVVVAVLVPPLVPEVVVVVPPPPPPPQPAIANATSPAAPMYIRRPNGRFLLVRSKALTAVPFYD